MPRLPSFEPDCTILFDGEPVPARRGEPVTAALLAAGRPLLARSAKYHRPRGPYCMAGACMSCLVRVDGLPSQRACRTPCRDGLVVETQNGLPTAQHDLLGVIDTVFAGGLDHHHLMTWNGLLNRATVAFSRHLAGLGKLPAPAALAAERAPGPVAQEPWDALVVGAGPAGLAAAEALAGGGLKVLVADGAPRIGGRLRCRLPLPGEPDLAWAERAAAAVRAAGGEIATSTTVLGLWRDGGTVIAGLGVDGPPRRLRLVRPARVLLAPGGHAVTPELANGDRPGVHAARGLSAAIAEHGVVPGARAAVLGEGPEANAHAAVLAGAGLAVERLPEFAGARVLGRRRVKGVATGALARIRCDVVAVAMPPAPATELARSLGARVRFDAGLEAFAVEAAADGATGVAGLWVAGEATGAMDGAGAREAGRRAGEAAR
ncbi:MAG: 2Fe-2S iron-sulfur cluster-binding protein [Anaeromyxobacter sp.]